jgi:BASS family bile acid:Na+ symporter
MRALPLAVRQLAFTLFVLVAVAVSLLHPPAFGRWFGYDLKNLIVPLIQIIMFGMGTTLSLRDFARVAVMPRPVLIGAALQFSVMPLLGFSIATAFGFEPEIGAGIILIGSVSGGVASNVMTYLAGGDVALSVTMTACSTVVSPFATPALMKLLAGRLIPVNVGAMMLEITTMVIVPIVAGVAANAILYSPRSVYRRPGPLAACAAAAVAVAIAGALLPSGASGSMIKVRNGVVLGTALIGIVAIAKLVLTVVLRRSERWMDRALPLLSMSSICFIIAIITARSSEQLLSVGLALIAAGAIHNLGGYCLGYWLAKACGLDEIRCRTISIEVGMQNGGMASAVAIETLGSVKAAVAPAIFGPLMNVTGSMLATWWRRRPVGRSGPHAST